MPFQKTPAIPAALRNAYLDSLPEPQELHLEDKVQAGEPWLLGDTAYAVIHQHQLVEFYSTGERYQQRCAHFEAAMATSGAVSVLSKSFDAPLMFAALSRPLAMSKAVTTVGLLFRRFNSASFVARSDVPIRLATTADTKGVWAINDNFFLSTAEIEGYLEQQRLFVAEVGGQIAGCGIGTDVIPEHQAVDIGMLVAKAWRGRGLASHMIGFLKEHFLQQGRRPICGCASDNVASAAALRRAGFVTEHRLVRIDY